MGGPNRADTPTVWVIMLLRHAANFGHFSDLPKFLIQDAPVSSSAERIALPWAEEVLAASALVEILAAAGKAVKTVMDNPLGPTA